MSTKAFNLPHKSTYVIPNIIGVEKWYVMSTSLGLHPGFFKSKQNIPEKPKSLPVFCIVASDKANLKEELCRLVDQIFEDHQQQEYAEGRKSEIANNELRQGKS